MKLRVFLPAAQALDPGHKLAWKLFDARDNLLREGVSALADIPRGDPVQLVLPAERVLFARIKLPRVSTSTIRELLPYAVEDRLLSDPAHVHAVPGATGERGETVVAVVERDWLQAMVSALERAGLRPTAAWSESALLAGGRDDWHVVLGAARGMLVDDEGVSATFDRAAGFPLALRIALDEAASRGARPQLVRVHTEGGEPLPDLERWSAEGGVPFAPGTQWEIIARGHPAAHSINLLQGELSPRGARRPRVPATVVALALIVVCLQATFSAVDHLRLSAERRELERRAEAIFRGAFPEARVVVDPQLQMARNLGELRRSRAASGGDEFLEQMTRAANGGTRVKAVEYAGGKLTTR